MLAILGAVLGGAAVGVERQRSGHAMALGVLSNTIFKLLVAVALGEERFRRLVPAGLAAMAAAAGISIAVLR